jgi:hypothetical protein
MLLFVSFELQFLGSTCLYLNTFSACSESNFLFGHFQLASGYRTSSNESPRRLLFQSSPKPALIRDPAAFRDPALIVSTKF